LDIKSIVFWIYCCLTYFDKYQGWGIRSILLWNTGWPSQQRIDERVHLFLYSSQKIEESIYLILCRRKCNLAIRENQSLCLATLYGIASANILWIPFGTKIKIKTEKEIYFREMILEGVLSIQVGENPRLLREKLSIYIPPDAQKRLEEGKKGGEQ
jgi:hypothetical protein